MTTIKIATSDRTIADCFPIIKYLRPHLQAEEFVERIRRQQESGYQLAFLAKDIRDVRDVKEAIAPSSEPEIKAVGGFRISECLAFGKFLYVDDLVTQEGDRSQGYGEELLQWMISYAKTHNCEQFHLDSGVQRFAAHRFYFRQRLEITSYHFALKL